MLFSHTIAPVILSISNSQIYVCLMFIDQKHIKTDPLYTACKMENIPITTNKPR